MTTTGSPAPVEDAMRAAFEEWWDGDMFLRPEPYGYDIKGHAWAAWRDATDAALTAAPAAAAQDGAVESAVAAEREACAKVADEIVARNRSLVSYGSLAERADTARAIATAIRDRDRDRARGQAGGAGKGGAK